MSARLESRYLAPPDYEAWDEAVSKSVGGSPYSSSGYLQALCNAAGGDFELLAVCDDSRIVGGIGLYVRSDNDRPYVRGRYLLYYNGAFVRQLKGAGPVAREERVFAVLTCIEDALRKSDFKPIEIKGCPAILDCRPFLQNGWRARPSYSYEVDISSPDACYSRMHRNVRRQIRQAQRAGIIASRSDDIESFYELHSQTCRRKGFPTYLERNKMAAFYRELSQQGIAQLYLAGEADSDAFAGAIVLAGGHSVSHTVCAASRDGKLPSGANALLRWNIFQDLAGAGYTINDLTDAHEPGVAKFKRQLGARLVVSQQLNLPATATDHMAAAYRTGKDQLKTKIKTLMRRGIQR